MVGSDGDIGRVSDGVSVAGDSAGGNSEGCDSV